MKKQNLPAKSNAPEGTPPASPKLRRTFTDQFKRDAVAQLRQDGMNASVLAIKLGVRRTQLYKWEKSVAALAPRAVLRSPGRPPVSTEDEVTTLRRKLAKVEQELLVLKKFDAYLTRLKK